MDATNSGETYVVSEECKVDVELDFILHDLRYNDSDDEHPSTKCSLPKEVSPSKTTKVSKETLKSFTTTDVIGSRVVYFNENGGWKTHGIFEGLHFMHKEQAKRAMEELHIQNIYTQAAESSNRDHSST